MVSVVVCSLVQQQQKHTVSEDGHIETDLGLKTKSTC